MPIDPEFISQASDSSFLLSETVVASLYRISPLLEVLPTHL